MLLNFKFENFRSFKNETIFSMIPSSKKMHSDFVIKKQLENNTIKALPAAIIYGANASGKSNIILAMYLLKKIVISGTLDDKEIEPYLNVLPFIHDESYFEPTKLEISFFQGKNIYQYGLSFDSKLNKHRIIEEYLYINNDNIFTRTSQGGVNMPIHELIRKGHLPPNDADEAFYKTLLRRLNETIDERQLSLFSGIKNLINNDYFIDIQKWFSKFIVVMDANDVSFDQKDLKSIEFQKNKSNELQTRQLYKSKTIEEILNYAEFGNQQIQFFSDVDKGDLSMVSLYKLPKYQNHDLDIRMVVTSELTESKGTIQLLRLIQPFIDALKVGGTVVLDEMDASLHFEIIVSLIRIFNSPAINKTGAQLIFNTHNPVYLDGTLLRHDQIIMVSKNKNNLVSELYSLSDYGLRPEERILKNYLDGKYGALPHMDLEIAFKHILESEDD